jgi:uncharacterized protein
MAEAFPEFHAQTELPDENIVPWTIIDTWVGLFLMVVVTAGFLVLSYFYRETILFQTIGLLGSELSLLLPILIIMGWRKASWGSFGLRKFNKRFLGIGCGFLLAAYVIVIINNLILVAFHISTQGDRISQLFLKLKYPYWLVVIAVFVAPLVEEIFFRGFLFAGIRQRYGWQKAAFISSVVFSIAHHDFAALIPTFVLGFTFAYLYHQAKSIWPGIVMHLLVNAMGMCALLIQLQLQHS